MMTELITKDKQHNTQQPIPNMEMTKLLAYALNLTISALYALGRFALGRGGKVEFQFGPFIYRVYGNREK